MPVEVTPVERFYGHRAERRAGEADGFLSFGYWPEGTTDYREAAEKLLEYFLARADIRSPGVVLNVCCGNGAETTRIHERVKPSMIHGLDITATHIETCRKRAQALGLSEKLVFEHGDACRTGFPAETFSHVIGIEGPAHFNTREAFFVEAHRVLKPGGQLLLTDSIVKKMPESLAGIAVAELCLRAWQMPRENWVDIDTYRRQLVRSGFRVEILEGIGHRVFPGFAAYNVQRSAVRDTMRVHGAAVGTGVVFLCWLLGHVYRRGFSDYLMVKAIKEG
jgi:cyclopropane fatty-acyl-phospholipid synthase-like methyltransferase